MERVSYAPIKPFFDNCRASRSTEVLDKYGPFRESKWIGHSTQVAVRHYCMILGSDFEAAVQESPESVQRVELPVLLCEKTGTNTGGRDRNGSELIGNEFSDGLRKLAASPIISGP